jgi:hypothetical protein
MWEDRLNVWRPEEDLEALLHAVIDPDTRWKDAWLLWRESADLDRLVPGAIRLLPLLYKRLKSDQMDDPWMGRLQGIYRHTWVRNQLLLRDATHAVRAFNDADIPVMLIKGAAMILSQYHDAGLCPTADMDMLVPDTQALAAVRCLRAAGFTAAGLYEVDVPERFIRIGCSHPFRSPQQNEIDLHWHLLYFRSFPGADESFWQNATRAEYSGLPVWLPSATDMLLVACLHGLCWSSTSNLRWVADADTLIRNASIDWNRLAEYSQWPGVALPLRLSLQYLRDRMGIYIPEESLRAIQSVKVSEGDRWVLMTYSSADNMFWNSLSIWFRHSRFSRERPASLFRLLAGFPSFLTTYWALPSIWHVPGAAIRKIFRHFRLNPSSGS